MTSALYGEDGFYRRQLPAVHFRTSAQNPAFAPAIAELIRRVDAALGHPDPFTVVDMAAGSGELSRRLVELEPLSGRLRAIGVELRDRPTDLPTEIGWRDSPPPRLTGLLVACEWLDNVAFDIAELTGDGPRYQLVDVETGDTAVGDPVSTEDAEWLARWWPIARIGDRAEIGRARDSAWSNLVSTVEAGLAVAVDYGHLLSSRPPVPTVTGFAAGRQLAPIPDATMDITAHVAMDSLMAGSGTLLRQRHALKSLGLTGSRPDHDQARRDPIGYLRGLSRAGEQAELLDPAGLGGHWWSVHGVGVDVDLIGSGD